MRKGIKRFAALAAFVLPLAALTAIPASAVHDTGAFELDGNAVTDNLSQTSGPDDWDRVCEQVNLNLGTSVNCSTTTGTHPSTIPVEWAAQGAKTGTTFTGGSSKDPLDTSGWLWQQGTGGLPGKDVLLNGFAARYTLPANNGPGIGTCPNGTDPATGTCSVMFFGMDRFDNSGDAQNGFWFFQNPITLGTTKSGGGFNFSGSHKNGDILVVSDFSIGGANSTISVYEWNSACTAAGKPVASCADSNLQLRATSDAASCALAAPGDAFCGIVNPTDGTPSPWSFADKSGNSSFLKGEFYEGGINLSLLGVGNECFASTLAESRSSASTSATLKSFVLGQLGQCSSSITTTAKDGNGGTITGPFSIDGGSVSVKDSATVTVGGVSTWSGTVSFFLCGPSANNSCASGSGTAVGSTPVNDSSPTVLSAAATVTSAGSYCWRGEFTSATTGVPNATFDGSGVTPPNPECFTVNPVTPTLTTAATIVGTPPNSTNIPATISDTAMLSGTAPEPGTPVINPTAAGGPAKGTITFTAYGPGATNCTSVVGTQQVSVNGDGTYGPVSFTVNAVGTYTFVASYSGDSPNTTGVGPTACPDPSTGTEHVTATDTALASSTQTWVPNDSATASSTSGQADLTGTLTIQLYTGTGCATGHEVSGQSYSKTVSGVATATVTSNNTVQVNGDASWLVTFTSTDPNVSGPAPHCENSTLTIAN